MTETADELSEGTGRRTSPPSSNLPEQLTSFVGRSDELASVQQLLRRGRLVTLVGTGGCGKTRLALQCLRVKADRFDDGAWLVELAALDDPSLLATTVGTALSLRDRPGKTPIDLLVDHLRDRQTLLLLDNCEHLLQPCATLAATLLQSCRGLVILATSREPLRIAGEVAYRVPALGLPPELDSPDDVAEADAVRLFVERAAQVRPGFRLTDENTTAVATTCRELGGLPLAIELAAARMRMLSPQRMAAMLDERLRLLTDGDRAVAQRHQTLRASIDWSHDLCSAQEQLVLRRLSVFAGGWTLVGAQEVCTDESIDPHVVIEVLSGLIDKSLVDVDEGTGDLRYRLLETIRQYADERLVQADEVEVVQRRHLAWCLGLAEQAEPQLVRHDAQTWLRRLDAEAANLRVALERAEVVDVEDALRLGAALTFFWVMQGRLEEGMVALGRVLGAATRPSATRARVWWGLAYLSIYRGRFEVSLEQAGQALVEGDRAGDLSVMARALGVQGLIVSLVDNLGGQEPLRRSLELARRASDEWGIAEAARLLGACYTRQSEHDLARPLHEESYALASSLGYRPHLAWYFNVRAVGELDHGHLEAARRLAVEAEEIAEAIGEPTTLGYAASVLVLCDVFQGQPSQGRTRAERCLQRTLTTGARAAEMWLRCELGIVDLAQGRPEAALARIDTLWPALALAPAYDTVARAYRILATARLLTADVEGAREQADLLLRHAASGRNQRLGAIAHHLLGRIGLADGRVREATAHLHEALTIAAQRDFRLQTIDALESLAWVSARTGNPLEAARLMAAAQGARARAGAVRWPPEPDTWGALEAELAGALGDVSFAVAWAEAFEMPLNEAVAYASRARGRRDRPPQGWESLTPTELEVARHAAGGLTNPQIAERMFIARATVKAHLSHIFAKLGMSTRAELAAEAARRGLDAGGLP